MKIFILTILLAAVGPVSAFLTVGNTNDCDYNFGATKIQDAINSGTDEVRLINGTYNENIIIDDIDLVLKGGYATCAQAEIDNQISSSIDTIINAASFGSTVKILGNTQRNNVTIDHIQITGGAGDFNALGGGINFNNADVLVNFNYIWIADNTNFAGGGISITGGDTEIYANNLMVINNSASYGGGIFCDGNAGVNSIFIYGDSDNGFGIAGNQANADTGGEGDGGGIYLSGGCEFTSYVGTANGAFDFRGVTSNTATRNGGGIHANTGSKVNLVGYQDCAFIFCFGYDSQPVNVTNNTANANNNNDGNGGGIYVTGSNTLVNVFNGLIANNTAYKGGGVAVTDISTFVTNSNYKQGIDCWSPGSCNQISDNLAIKNGGASSLGGAVYVVDGGKAMVHRTHVQRNRADYGTAVFTSSLSSSFTSEGSLFTDNGDGGTNGTLDFNVFRVVGSAILDLSYATITDNNSINSVINNSIAILRVNSSIIYESNGALVYSGNVPSVDVTITCVVVHENLSFEGLIAIAANPSFIDPANGDYHINWATSPAVDLCDDNIASPLYTDIDNQQRGWDWPGIFNQQGSFDAGFDEQDDLIFANGF